MKLYLAGVFPEGLYRASVDKAYIHRKPWKKYRTMYYLESYFEIRNNTGMVECIRKRGDKIFLDSGAYSAFTQGIDIDLRDYAYFIKENDDVITVASNFDVIGRHSEKETYENQRQLESLGAKVCPVHHARDDDKWLVKYIEDGYKYIFLGGMVPESTPYLLAWLDRMWGDYLTKKNGKPLIKVHGFGLTIEQLMTRYPWYSVDSTSWKIYAIMGYVVFPVGDRFLQSICVSERHGSRKQRNRHYAHLSPKEKKILEKIFKKYGFNSKRLVEDRTCRSVFNSLIYHNFMHNGNFSKKFRKRQIQLFN